MRTLYPAHPIETNQIRNYLPVPAAERHSGTRNRYISTFSFERQRHHSKSPNHQTTSHAGFVCTRIRHTSEHAVQFKFTARARTLSPLSVGGPILIFVVTLTQSQAISQCPSRTRTHTRTHACTHARIHRHGSARRRRTRCYDAWRQA